MGSLMAGWDSPPADPKSSSMEGRRSMTRMEIESYWLSHPRSPGDEQHLQVLHMVSPRNQAKQSLSREGDAQANAKLIGDWWTRSNSAYLNEPVSDEGVDESGTNEVAQRKQGPASFKYESQFQVAQLTAGK